MKLFNQVKVNRPKSSVFDLSHERKLTLNMGELIPIYMDEILPGDKFKVNTEILIRFHQMIAPIMHRIDATIHYFYVPNRIIFDDWDKFITGGEDGNDITPFPTIGIGAEQIPIGSLGDYFGLPAGSLAFSTTTVNALPFRAYTKIWDEYYRDQNLQAKSGVTGKSTVDGNEKTAIIKLRKRSWQKDYFTSALPWAQKGGEVLLPMEPDVRYSEHSYLIDGGGAAINQDKYLGLMSSGTDGRIGTKTNLTGGDFTNMHIENIESIENASTTINDLRTATRVQEWLEKNARAGSRLFESILVHFGVVSDDLRISRPKYLGGGKVPVTISEVLSTNEGTELDLGQMGGHGISVGNNAGFKGYFKEHGWVMGLLTIMPKPAYQNGLHRLWSRVDKFDFAWPEFANLGEQEIKNKELFYDWDDEIANNEKTWGYTPRYSEYKFGMSTVHGDFREALDFWHAGRQFASLPALAEDFITCNTSEIDNRIFPVADSQATDKCYVQLYNNVKAVRPLPYYGTPRL
jgi:hypothetical protein